MNEDEHLTLRVQQCAQFLYRYIAALEQGDGSTMQVLLQEAEHDPALERLILEVNTMYQSVDGLVVTPEEVQHAQQFLHSYLLSAQSTNIVLLTTIIDDHDDHEQVKMNGRYDTVSFPSSERKRTQERIDSAMKTIASPEETFSTPPANNRRSRERPVTNTRLHHMGRFVQMLAAVLVVAALIGGFAFIAVSHIKTQAGSSDTGQLNGAWRLVPNPNPGAGANQLQGVVALSKNDAWAVGNYGVNPGEKSYTLIEHWNGKQWQVVQSQSPGTVANDLTAVAAISPDNIWAVGSSSTIKSNENGVALIEHWNGKQWSVVPNPPGSDLVALQGITALSAEDIWAVGSNGSSTFIEHWNGTAWTVVPSPNLDEPTNMLMGVKALSANDVWAVGFAEGPANPPGQSQPVQRGLIEHWNGTKWSIVSSPNPAGVQCMLYGMTAISTNNVWAVGVTLEYSNDTSTTLVEHWNGTRWSVVNSPNMGAEDTLMQVNAISSNNVWAVGYYSRTSQDMLNGISYTEIEHWDGTRWSIIASPNPKTPTINLWSVAGVPGSNQVWAVGSYGQGGTTLSFSELFS